MRLRAPKPLPTTLDGLGLRTEGLIEGTFGGGPFYKGGARRGTWGGKPAHLGTREGANRRGAWDAQEHAARLQLSLVQNAIMMQRNWPMPCFPTEICAALCARNTIMDKITFPTPQRRRPYIIIPEPSSRFSHTDNGRQSKTLAPEPASRSAVGRKNSYSWSTDHPRPTPRCRPGTR